MCNEVDELTNIFTEVLLSKECHPYYKEYYANRINNGFINGKYLDLFSVWESRIGCRDKSILELGCGFGDFSLFLALKNARRICGVEVVKDFSPMYNKLIEVSKVNKNKILLEFEILNTNCELEFHDETFDVVFTRDVLSHVINYEKMINEMVRILKPNGVLYVSDDNNRRSILKVILNQRIYKKVDKDYYEIRKDIIDSCYQELDNHLKEKLVKSTFGYTKEEIETLCRELQCGRSTKVIKKTYCRSPLSGSYDERLLDPLFFRKILERKGFSVKNYPRSYLDVGKNGIYSKLVSYLHPFSMIFSLGFDIVARKNN